MYPERLNGMIGLAKRAGRLVTGTDAVIACIQSGKAVLVLAASDASEGTQKRIRDKCGTYNVRQLVWGTAQQLGHTVGMGSCAAAAVTDRNFAEGISRIYNELTGVAE